MTSLRLRHDSKPLNADLHCHSTISDGVLEPDALARRAHEKGVELWALTDHDEIGGIAAASRVAEAIGLPFVPGVEISVSWGSETLHIVGLRVDPDDDGLREGLERTRSGRTRRAHDMAAQLAEVGIPDAFEGALKYVGNPNLIGRTHFARYIVEVGRCGDVREVFGRFLVAGKPGYVAVQWSTLDEAVSWIRGAGGTAVIAHPGRYRLDDAGLRDLFARFRDLGGAAIEVVTGSHSSDQYKRFASYAKEFGFMGSRGSDFHGPEESRYDLGTLPPLPDSVVPIWHDW